MTDEIDAVDALEFTKAVGKRAVYEEFAFRPLGEGDVEVTNESHGDADGEEDHTYTVHVVGGIPSDCECPADTYNTVEGACKHRVALAMRPALLEAAEHGADEPLLADGGVPEHLTKVSTIDGGAVFHCQTCGAEGDAPDAVAHHPECPDDDTPTRHEPADFGGGDSTGVEDL